MANTIYASFSDPALAEKAAGALLDHGVRAEDISVVKNDQHGHQYGDQNIANQPRISDENTTVNYQGTENTQTWTGDSVNPDINRQTYTGAAGTTYEENPVTTTVPPLVNDANPTSYGDTAYETAHTGDFDRTNVPPVSEFDRTVDYDANQADREVRDHDRDAHRHGGDPERDAKQGISTTTAADAGAGAAKGAAWGVGIGVLAALASLMIPGVGLVIGGGALATALGGLAATTGAGAISGAVYGYLRDQGMEEHVAQNYENTVRGGGAIIAVTTPSGNVDEATIRQTLDKYGAANVNTGSRPYVS